MPYGDLYEDDDIFDHMPINLDPATDRSVDLSYLRYPSSFKGGLRYPSCTGLYREWIIFCTHHTVRSRWDTHTCS